MKIKRLLVLLFPSFEETEALVAVDVWRRAGIEVVTASITDKVSVCGAHAITCKADQLLNEVNIELFDGIFIPGGPGVFKLQEDEHILALIRSFSEANKWIAAICAAPILLKCAGCLPKKFTAHDCIAGQLPGCDMQSAFVVDSRTITGRGPGAVFPFAFELTRTLTSDEVILQLKKSMHYED